MLQKYMLFVNSLELSLPRNDNIKIKTKMSIIFKILSHFLKI